MHRGHRTIGVSGEFPGVGVQLPGELASAIFRSLGFLGNTENADAKNLRESDVHERNSAKRVV